MHRMPHTAFGKLLLKQYHSKKHLLLSYNTENSSSSLSPVISIQLNVNNVRGRVIGNRIQCTFAATVPDSASVTSRSNRASSLALAISTGPFNSSKLTSYRYTLHKTPVTNTVINIVLKFLRLLTNKKYDLFVCLLRSQLLILWEPQPPDYRVLL